MECPFGIGQVQGIGTSRGYDIILGPQFTIDDLDRVFAIRVFRAGHHIADSIKHTIGRIKVPGVFVVPRPDPILCPVKTPIAVEVPTDDTPCPG